MSRGHLSVIGLGPGNPDLLAPRAAVALAAADHLFGYGPYLDRVPPRDGQERHASDNREELVRARMALERTAQGQRVAIVSGGDSGVFGMAAAVFEALEMNEAWCELDIEVIPGISAMLAAAARIGAPLGHDFCVVSLSDNLKPWPVVLARLIAAASAGFVIVLYNPASRARPWHLDAAFDALRTVLDGATQVAFATAISRADEHVWITTLAEADAAQADMRTLVLIGTAATRRIERPGGVPWLYTPRHNGGSP